jgi:release factor glutamine methyltransferase
VVSRGEQPAGPKAEGPWTIRRVLAWTAGYFKEKGITSPRLDADLLLAHSLSTERLQLYLDLDRPLTPAELADFRALVRRRARREPLAYIVGHREFAGLRIATRPGALVPRPETEHLLEACLAHCRETGLESPEILEIGTGSGCIAVALALALPRARIVATDISAEALEIAAENIRAAGVEERIRLLQGDLFGPLEPGERFHVVLSNPPYVASAQLPTLAPEISVYEPRVALDGGPDGLSMIRRLLVESGGRLQESGVLFLEVGAGQKEAVEAAAAQAWIARHSWIPDLAGIPRVFAAYARLEG